MAISYLRGRSWAEWSREERLFCAILYEHARREPTAFAEWLVQEARLDVLEAGDWELGFEVCFYRDYLWHLGRSARQEGFSPKRTFDLCLFSEQAVIVIEAKVCEPFDLRQNKVFRNDARALRAVLEKPALRVELVALASSKYFANGHLDALEVFSGRLTWAAVGARYADPRLARADAMYRLSPMVCP